MITNWDQIKLVDANSEKVTFSLHFQTKDTKSFTSETFDEQCRKFIPFVDDIPHTIYYICDVCQRQYLTPEYLTTHQCVKCNQYFDTCPDCQVPTDGCYICKNPPQPLRQQVDSFVQEIESKIRDIGKN